MNLLRCECVKEKHLMGERQVYQSESRTGRNEATQPNRRPHLDRSHVEWGNSLSDMRRPPSARSISSWPPPTPLTILQFLFHGGSLLWDVSVIALD